MGFVGALHSLRSFRRRLPLALGHGLTPALETFGRGVLQHSVPCSAEHAGMVYQASVASWQIMRLASIQAWRQVANWFAAGRSSQSQSGCQSFGCQLITALRQSATRHRQDGCLSFGNQHSDVYRVFATPPNQKLKAAVMAAPSLLGVFALCWCHSMRRLIGAKTEQLGALVKRCPPIGARHRSGSGNAITQLGHGRFAQPPWPNSAVKRTPTLAMPSASSWPVSVPSTRCAPSGAAYLGR